MKIIRLLRGDITFQYRYGFHVLYALFTLIYIITVNLLPEAWREQACWFFILSDPTLIGLIFMGAIILFEKSERVLNSIATSPISIPQYILSKLLSIALIALLSGALIAGFSIQVPSWTLFMTGILLGSALFSLFGIITGANAQTLNGFLIRIIPIMLLSIAPAALPLLDINHWSLSLHPGIAVINLLTNADNMQIPSIVALLIWISTTYLWTIKKVSHMMQQLGGIRL